MTKEVSLTAEALDRSTILSIVIISVLVSILSLIVPIAAQTLVNLIAFGKLLQPVFTLSFMVFILMASLGALSVWQLIIIETIQQKLMVKISLNLTEQLAHLSINSFSTHYGPELVNRFFEIVTVKKSLASLLIYGINLGLQVFFGLILLLAYHPLFIIFDGFIIISVLLIVFLPHRKAMDSAKQECDKKHKIGTWLEEILINRFLFKFNFYDQFVLRETDRRLVEFLKVRNQHFKELIKQQTGFYVLSALATSLLLGLGGYLVINNQLSLGQLVASEIVLGSFIYAFKRFGTLLENYYDLRASSDKIGALLNLPTEKVQKSLGFLSPLDHIRLQFNANYEAVVTLSRPLIIKTDSSDLCQNLVEELFGFTKHNLLEIDINGVPCDNKHLVPLRHHSLLITGVQWFAGSIYDNLFLSHKSIANKEVYALLERLRLIEKIRKLPEDLQTVIYDWQSVFTEVELTKLMIARAFFLKPQLLVIDRSLDLFDSQTLQEILILLQSLDRTLLIILSKRSDLPLSPHFLSVNL
ncbi:ABC transporter transmembrane domain-containing protein [Legionella micdadei]|uniref:ABC-type bacteriocin/lantibiotic exporter, contains an N-terminal double-glycine peptidase domain n=1 Tax=Legionella micdadei TaxID=451 RepID=A0A098GJ77_LEGMI|nr:ABC transporter ATP-binding protein [Legionella micdadei]ARG97029.1 ABC transporter ATP-binding protein [Legionella micdadei]KTD26746.1 toxin secretion ABC transporter HlyB/MsbA family transporter ATP-binding protein [Legionella micdadei]NSL18250.1 ABC transporter ATP-binding protein [Legionella micdadei]CEG61556.1 Xenobiotic-transporting ATPase [Legionella micdadei]SCY45840.1 ABC-type bacteriocin/lantibiotic exporter, contains an N-terminal double-glycine peptidase domain [Legionella micda